MALKVQELTGAWLTLTVALLQPLALMVMVPEMVLPVLLALAVTVRVFPLMEVLNAGLLLLALSPELVPEMVTVWLSPAGSRLRLLGEAVNTQLLLPLSKSQELEVFLLVVAFAGP